MGEPEFLRVMTWNVWGRYADWSSRGAIIEETLKNVSADIIALQEVWAESTSGGCSQAQILSNALGYDYHSSMTTNFGDYSSGNSLLTRWPMANKSCTALPADVDRGANARAAVHATVMSPFGSIPVISTHLSWQRNLSDLRQLQTQALSSLAFGLTSAPWPPILMGDFNSDPDSDEIRIITGKSAVPRDSMVFQDAWEQGGDGSRGYTWTPSNAHYAVSRRIELAAMPWLRRRLDYIFVGLPDGMPGNIAAIQVERAFLRGTSASDGSEGSDHFAVVAELRPQYWIGTD